MKKYLSLLALAALIPTHAHAHAVAGDRVFPATLAIEDPDVQDELVLPQVENFYGDEDGGRVTSYSGEYSKRITKDFGLSVEGAYISQSRSAGGGDGFDNFGASAKYVFIRNAPHEFIVSTGVDLDIGNTGSKLIGAEHFDTITPQIFFGKGFGDLPDSATYLKPFALTGQVGVGFPTRLREDEEQNPTTMNYGFSVQYSLPYLQQHVKDIGLSAPFDRVIPIVEMNFETPIAHSGGSNATTGTINPGIIWEGKAVQFGLEAELPINDRSGHGVGGIAEVHFFLDELFPHSLGRPIFD